MRELLKKAIVANPGSTESYELLAFVNLVNNEELDEAVAYLQKAVQLQPGNQRYALRISEIYMRQQKLAEASAVVEKVVVAAIDPQIKTQAENLKDRIRRTQEMLARQPYSRRQNKTSRIISDEIPLPPEVIAEIEKEEQMRSINQSLGKLEDGEKRFIGRIQKIECKDKTVIYTVLSEGETFALTSGDFENLTLVAYVAGMKNIEIGCGADVAAMKSVLTYKPQTDAKSNSRGELTAVDFVPEDFVFMEPDENLDEADREQETVPPIN